MLVDRWHDIESDVENFRRLDGRLRTEKLGGTESYERNVDKPLRPSDSLTHDPLGEFLKLFEARHHMFHEFLSLVRAKVRAGGAPHANPARSGPRRRPGAAG